ncbi:uncharacterized protein CTRU02_210289 [Colletotrichum truncatum]|uniref:Uncharacterized protein n=1 Tax=Colletotrichum truncatum TaxID=5467 RepID=A0ACC3YUV4_COLTU|nr:uncharacterized protein CTRU02_11502 [Colletotrichum truncatum]KAF6785877.1 hypothetical protein CTRU02_11502 [Colletotrichum truncatum]
MKLHLYLALGLAPVPILANLNAYEILMFYDMYRSDYEKDSSSVKIAKGCKDCDFEQFVIHIDRLNIFSDIDGGFVDPKNPGLDEIEGWGDSDELVYDAKKLLGGLWRDEDNSSRPGHPTVIERLVDRMTELRKDGDPARLEQITGAMEYAHYSRRSSQAKDLLAYVDGRLSKERLGKGKTRSVGYFGGVFDEFDSTATIESVQQTKRAAMRKEIVAIGRDINSGSVSTSSNSKRSLANNQLLKRAFGDGMTVMSLQRGLDTLRMPSRRKC